MSSALGSPLQQGLLSRKQPCFLPATPFSRKTRRLENTPISAENNNDLLSKVEEEVRGAEASSSGKGFGTQPKVKKQQKTKERPFELELPQGQEDTPAQQFEGSVVRLLAAIFVVFIAEGLSLAVAGFLPPAADDFITTYIYPSFSPTLGVFLAISVVYGLFKSRQGTQ